MSADIYITYHDKERIQKMIDDMTKGNQSPDQYVRKLDRELKRAVIVAPRDIPGDVVTMNSRALLHLNGEDTEVSVVYPEDADVTDMKLSVFSPIGTAILGYREGSTVEWEVPSGNMQIRIEKILYQPEAAGDGQA